MHELTGLLQMSLEELERKRGELISEINSIEIQLTDKDKKNLDGSRMTSEEYWTWRRKAKTAHGFKSDQLREVNRQIKETRKTQQLRQIEEVVDATDSEELIRAALALLKKLASEGVELDPEEQAVLDGMRHYLSLR